VASVDHRRRLSRPACRRGSLSPPPSRTFGCRSAGENALTRQSQATSPRDRPFSTASLLLLGRPADRFGVVAAAHSQSRRGLTRDIAQASNDCMDIDRAMKNPASVFDTPEALSASTELTAEQKLAILLQWKDQLLQLQAADDEGMRRSEGAAGVTTDVLARVTSALSRIDADSKRTSQFR
jgi:hypothetical protein